MLQVVLIYLVNCLEGDLMKTMLLVEVSPYVLILNWLIEHVGLFELLYKSIEVLFFSI